MNMTTVDATGCPKRHLPDLELFASCDRVTLFDAEPALDSETRERVYAADGTPMWLGEADRWRRQGDRLVRSLAFVAVPFADDLRGRIQCHVRSHRDWPTVTLENVRFHSEAALSHDTFIPYYEADALHGSIVYEEQEWFERMERELGSEGSHEES